VDQTEKENAPTKSEENPHNLLLAVRMLAFAFTLFLYQGSL
jgi:hypothetical protein